MNWARWNPPNERSLPCSQAFFETDRLRPQRYWTVFAP